MAFIVVFSLQIMEKLKKKIKKKKLLMDRTVHQTVEEMYQFEMQGKSVACGLLHKDNTSVHAGVSSYGFEFSIHFHYTSVLTWCEFLFPKLKQHLFSYHFENDHAGVLVV